MAARGRFQPKFFNVSMISYVIVLFIFFCASGFVWLCLVIALKPAYETILAGPDLRINLRMILESRKTGHSFTFTNISLINCSLLLSLTFHSLRTCFDSTAAKTFLRKCVTQVGERKGDSVTY